MAFTFATYFCVSDHLNCVDGLPVIKILRSQIINLVGFLQLTG